MAINPIFLHRFWPPWQFLFLLFSLSLPWVLREEAEEDEEKEGGDNGERAILEPDKYNRITKPKAWGKLFLLRDNHTQREWNRCMARSKPRFQCAPCLHRAANHHHLSLPPYPPPPPAPPPAPDRSRNHCEYKKTKISTSLYWIWFSTMTIL